MLQSWEWALTNEQELMELFLDIQTMATCKLLLQSVSGTEQMLRRSLTSPIIIIIVVLYRSMFVIGFHWRKC